MCNWPDSLRHDGSPVLFFLFGGILSDKLGRKFTTMMGDFSDGGWPVWCGLFRTISGCFGRCNPELLEQINQTAWYCLLIEDARPKDLVGIYYLGK
jgi:hypothetical protein